MVPTRASRSTGGAASQETELILEDVAVKTKTLRRLEERCAWRQARRWAPVCLESRRRQRRRTSCGSVLASLNLNSKPECKNWGGRWRTETKRLKFEEWILISHKCSNRIQGRSVRISVILYKWKTVWNEKWPVRVFYSAIIWWLGDMIIPLDYSGLFGIIRDWWYSTVWDVL